jgi:hypothetical protein
MTCEQYYAAVRRLGLNPSTSPTVYVSKFGDCYNVPLAERYTPEQRAEIIDQLKELLGISSD